MIYKAKGGGFGEPQRWTTARRRRQTRGSLRPVALSQGAVGDRVELSFGEAKPGGKVDGSRRQVGALVSFVKDAPGPRPGELTASGKKAGARGASGAGPPPALGSWDADAGRGAGPWDSEAPRTLSARRFAPDRASRSRNGNGGRDQRRENRCGSGLAVCVSAGGMGRGQGQARAGRALPAAATAPSGSCRRPVGRHAPVGISRWPAVLGILGAAERVYSGFLQRRLRPRGRQYFRAGPRQELRGQRVASARRATGFQLSFRRRRASL